MTRQNQQLTNQLHQYITCIGTANDDTATLKQQLNALTGGSGNCPPRPRTTIRLDAINLIFLKNQKERYMIILTIAIRMVIMWLTTIPVVAAKDPRTDTKKKHCPRILWVVVHKENLFVSDNHRIQENYTIR